MATSRHSELPDERNPRVVVQRSERAETGLELRHVEHLDAEAFKDAMPRGLELLPALIGAQVTTDSHHGGGVATISNKATYNAQLNSAAAGCFGR